MVPPSGREFTVNGLALQGERLKVQEIKADGRSCLRRRVGKGEGGCFI